MSGHLIENTIKEKLTGDAQKNALDFITYMLTNRFLSEQKWDIIYKGEAIGCMSIDKYADAEEDEFWIWFFPQCDFGSGDLVDDDFKETIWAHVPICPQQRFCSRYCDNSKNRWKIFGKEFESTCHAPLAFENPDAKTFDNVKKLMLMLK